MSNVLKFTAMGLLVVLLLAGASLLNSRPWQRSTLDLAAFKMVTPGMNRAEVERLLGGPPGDYGFHQGGPTSEVILDWELPPEAHLQEWFNDQFKLQIAFDAQGRVLDKRQVAAFHRSPTKLSWRYWWNCYIK